MMKLPNIERIARIPRGSSDETYQALAAILVEARKGSLVDVPPDSYIEREVAVKENLLVQQGLLAISLTKKRHGQQQLRGWVSPSHHLRAGQHADGYGHGAVFEDRGSFRVLRALTEEYLAGDFQCFEDENFVVWRRRDGAG